MRKRTPIEQQLAIELDAMSLAFLSSPSALTLKEGWLEIYSNIVGEHIVWNCPDFQHLLAITAKQLNVIQVLYDGDVIIERTTGVKIPRICFRKDMLTVPLLKEEQHHD